MKLTDFLWLPYSDDKDDYRDHIADAAVDEDWGRDRRYLWDYVRDNFELAYKQGLVREAPDKTYMLFRLGTLTTREGEPITMLGIRNNKAGREPYVYKTIFKRKRFTVHVHDIEATETAPDAPRYSPPPYHPEYNLVFNFSHYLEDHEARTSERLPNINSHQRFLCIYAALQIAHKRWESCAVPQWYCDKKAEEGDYQWLLPLNITSEDVSRKPDFVATLEPIEEYNEYNIRTMVPPEFCYGHARAISGRDPQFRNWA
jgi:hypothetical protein